MTKQDEIDTRNPNQETPPHLIGQSTPQLASYTRIRSSGSELVCRALCYFHLLRWAAEVPAPKHAASQPTTVDVIMVYSRQHKHFCYPHHSGSTNHLYDSGWCYDAGSETQAGNNLISEWPPLFATMLPWATGWSAPVVKLGNNVALDVGVMFDANLHCRRS